jgi:hypothetical protein
MKYLTANPILFGMSKEMKLDYVLVKEMQSSYSRYRN